MLGRGGYPLFGADDVGDLHEVVVDDVGEVVGGEAVGLHQYLIVDVVVLEGDVAAQLVAKCSRSGRITRVRRDGHAHDERLPRSDVGCDTEGLAEIIDLPAVSDTSGDGGEVQRDTGLRRFVSRCT